MIKIFLPGLAPFEPEFLTFNGGEEHVNLGPASILRDYTAQIVVKAKLKTSADILRLLLTTNALRLLYPNPITLNMPYVPYARQDRACTEGDAFSFEVFAELINAQKYSSVQVVDLHSYVAAALIKRVSEMPQDAFAISTQLCLHREFRDVPQFVIAPDAGASKKAFTFAQRIGSFMGVQPETVQALKVRNKNGAITSTTVLYDDFAGGSVLIVDDICDGGRTFIELAKCLKAKNAGNIYLFVTHGIFSQGIEPLLESGIKHVFTTDSWYAGEYAGLGVTIVLNFF